MKNNFFNKGLYLDALKQLRKAGIVLFILTLVTTVLPPIITYSFNSHYYDASDLWNIPANPPSIQNVVPMLTVVVFIGAMCLAYTAFSFLNKRNASDFYHALPNQRSCTYITLLTAVLTWLCAVIIAIVLLVAATYAMVGNPFNASYIPLLIFSNMSGAFLIVAASLIAVSISGTRFTNVMLTAVILVLPRMLMMLFSSLVSNASPVLTQNPIGGLFDTDLNMVTRLLLSGFSSFYSVSEALSNVTSILYTFVLSFVYMALGGIAFHKRKSELAGMSAPKRIWQNIYRSLITLPIMLMALVFDYNSYDYGIILFVIIVASLVVYFLYELITTKKAKNLIRIIPQYFILVLFCLVFALSAGVLGRSMGGRVIAAGEIASVDVGEIYHTYHMQSYSNNLPTYLDLQLQDLKIENDELNTILSAALEKSMDAQNNRPYHEYNIHLKNGETLVRRIGLENNESQRVYQILLNDGGLTDALAKLPAQDEIKDIFLPGLSNEQAKTVWEELVKEISELPKEQKILLMHSVDNNTFLSLKLQEFGYESEDFYQPISNIVVTGSVRNKNFRDYYALTALTPKTTKLALDLINQSTRNDFKIKEENSGYVLVFYGLHDDVQSTEYHHIDLPWLEEMGKKEEAVALLKSLKAHTDIKLDNQHTIVALETSKWDEALRVSKYFKMYVCVHNDELEEIVTLVRNFNPDSRY